MKLGFFIVWVIVGCVFLLAGCMVDGRKVVGGLHLDVGDPNQTTTFKLQGEYDTNTNRP